MTIKTTCLIIFFILISSGGFCSMNLTVDADFSGGNISLERIEGNDVFLHQQLRDTTRDWFYWYFRVRGGAGENLNFHFTQSHAIGARGPSCSLDGGETWHWLNKDCVDGNSFRYTVPPDAEEARFSFGMPYLESTLHQFLDKYKGHPNLDVSHLCQTPKGRNVEKIRIGAIDGQAAHRVLLTCRHHSCEMMASYALEGLMDTLLADTEIGRRLSDQVEFLIIPFVDKDGVEDGDQGKARKPHDHNRDYEGDSIYSEVQAIRELIPEWSGGKLRAAIDLHCPYISGSINELIYLVGSDCEETWEQQKIFSQHLENSINGPLPYKATNNLPFGKHWNTEKRRGPGTSFGAWARNISTTGLATTIEIPYANAQGEEVNQETTKEFGKDLAGAIDAYLAEIQ